MIKSVWVKNYRSIADIRVNLEPVTIHAFEEIVTAANNGKPVITPIDKA
ncbi:MAG: hypothetical protein ACOYNY_16250 [Caldilineaceae bacterium]